MRPRIVLSLALPALLLAGCSGAAQQAAPPPPASSSQAAASPSAQASPVTKPAGGGTVPAACSVVEAQMSPRQRLAQLLYVGVTATNPAAAANLVRTEQVGGIFIPGNPTNLFRGNALGPVKQAAHWGLDVAIDEEGGRVQRIDDLDGEIPSAREMARTMTVDQVRELGRRRGQEMAARGVTTDFAPILDVSSEADDGPIGDRSFSADPRRARDYGLAFADGLRQAGITPVFKHFPGHGHASGDSHAGAVVTPPLAALRGNDLLPYDGIGAFAGASVMVGHLTVPDLTNGRPATLSPEAYRLLRSDYHFTGPVITDDLGGMKAITSTYTLPDAVTEAIKDGADRALWSDGGDVGPVLDRLQQAQASGELPASRVDEALGRVLKSRHTCD